MESDNSKSRTEHRPPKLRTTRHVETKVSPKAKEKSAAIAPDRVPHDTKEEVKEKGAKRPVTETKLPVIKAKRPVTNGHRENYDLVVLKENETALAIKRAKFMRFTTAELKWSAISAEERWRLCEFVASHATTTGAIGWGELCGPCCGTCGGKRPVTISDPMCRVCKRVGVCVGCRDDVGVCASCINENDLLFGAERVLLCSKLGLEC